MLQASALIFAARVIFRNTGIYNIAFYSFSPFLSRYTYGKPVRGTAVVYLSIAGFDGQIIKFGKHTIVVSFSPD